MRVRYGISIVFLQTSSCKAFSGKDLSLWPDVFLFSLAFLFHSAFGSLKLICTLTFRFSSEEYEEMQ